MYSLLNYIYIILQSSNKFRFYNRFLSNNLLSKNVNTYFNKLNNNILNNIVNLNLNYIDVHDNNVPYYPFNTKDNDHYNIKNNLLNFNNIFNELYYKLLIN